VSSKSDWKRKSLATKVDLEEDSAQQTDKNAELVSVVVYSSNSQNLGSSVILRGETEAARFVQVRAETFGQVISDPLRKGSFVQKDDILCRLDEGTRKAALADSLARLEEAKALIPQTEAKLGEATPDLKKPKSISMLLQNYLKVVMHQIREWHLFKQQ
jgi:multidrug efflux system membrane fusion protein